jgi:hypothetical protein
MASATRDRDGLRTPGAEQWYPVAGGARVYRHTLVAVGSSGYLAPLSDVAERLYVGVSGAAIFRRGGFSGGDADGERTCPVWQDGEFQFLYQGGATQAEVGQIAYALDDQTVTTDRALTAQGYAVGRVAKLVSPTLVRVNITGFATTAIALFLCAWRTRFSLEPHAVTAPTVGTNYRIGVTLPAAFSELTYSGELLCDVTKVIVNRGTGQKRTDYCEWNLYVPSDTPAAGYGGWVDLVLTPYFAGEGWRLGPGPFAGVWDPLTEIL